MTNNNVLEFAGRDAISDPLTALLRSGAQQLINQAVESNFRNC
jgi:putative transposase